MDNIVEDVEHQLVDLLIRSSPVRVTYDQIESAMRSAGLDPFEENEVYEAIMEGLLQRDVLVSDQDELAPGDLVRSDVAAQELADEVVGELKRVVDKLNHDGRRLLRAEEERRLLEICHDGVRASRESKIASSNEEIYHINRRIRAADEALEELVGRNSGLVAQEAIRAARRTRHLEIEDLMQEGLIGFIRAVQRFDLGDGGRLSTYAVYWIRQAIERAIADQDRVIRLPVHRVDMIRRLRAAEVKLIQVLGRDPTDEELAQELGLLATLPDGCNCTTRPPSYLDDPSFKQTKKKPLEFIRLIRHLDSNDPVSLDTMAGENGESELVDFIPDLRTPDPLACAIRKQLCEQLEDILNGIATRERRVIEYRFGLADGNPYTLEEIGSWYGVTRERIRQIEDKGLRKLRHPIRSRKLRDYWEA